MKNKEKDEKLDLLYKELLQAQLDKNWGKVAKIQIKINEIDPFPKGLDGDSISGGEDTPSEGEGAVAENPPCVRDH